MLRHRPRPVVTVFVATLGLVTLLLIGPPPASASPGWRWPVRGPVLTRFDVGPDPFARGQRRGIAIGAPTGTIVRSACRGTVTFAGAVGDAGRVVSVACTDGLTATYLHLAVRGARRGAQVAVGERIGTVGRSGRPALPLSHLQFGVHRTGERWAYVDPLSLLDGPTASPPPITATPGRRPGSPGAPGDAAPPRTLGRAPTPAFAAHALAVNIPPAAVNATRSPGPAIPAIVWVGSALLVLALPGWGLGGSGRRRRLRSARRVAEPQPGAGRPII